MGIGVIIRAELGGVVAAWSKLCLGLLEPMMGEAISLFHDVIFEGDAKQVVDAINLTMSIWSRFGHLIEDTRQILQLLSKQPISNVSDRIWRDQIPNCISDIVLMKQVALSF